MHNILCQIWGIVLKEILLKEMIEKWPNHFNVVSTTQQIMSLGFYIVVRVRDDGRPQHGDTKLPLCQFLNSEGLSLLCSQRDGLLCLLLWWGGSSSHSYMINRHHLIDIKTHIVVKLQPGRK